MKRLYITKSEFAIVDDSDYELVKRYKWRIQKIKNSEDLAYALAFINGKYVLMHRLLTDAKEGFYVDHVNSNGLDNRRENLRICTCSQNAMNQRKQKRQTSSIYKGVRLHHYSKKWEVRIKKDGVRYHLGSFESELDAAMAYNNAAKNLFGEFARLNEI